MRFAGHVGRRVPGAGFRWAAYCGGAPLGAGEAGTGGGVVCAGGAEGAEKSTAGGFEIAASFSTEKFGFVL